MIADVKGYIRPTHYTTASLGGLTFDAFARRQKSYAAWSKELLESLENSCLDIGGTLTCNRVITDMSIFEVHGG